MSQTTENPDCKIPVNLILEAAHRLFSYGKVPFAQALIYVVLEQYPDHSHARMLYQVFMGENVPDYPISRRHRLYYDAEKGMFFVGDKEGKGDTPFKTLGEAEKYLRKLK